MPTQDELDVLIADLENVTDRLRAVRAKQVMQQAHVLPFPPQLRLECCGDEGRCVGCPMQDGAA